MTHCIVAVPLFALTSLIHTVQTARVYKRQRPYVTVETFVLRNRNTTFCARKQSTSEQRTNCVFDNRTRSECRTSIRTAITEKTRLWSAATRILSCAVVVRKTSTVWTGNNIVFPAHTLCDRRRVFALNGLYRWWLHMGIFISRDVFGSTILWMIDGRRKFVALISQKTKGELTRHKRRSADL